MSDSPNPRSAFPAQPGRRAVVAAGLASLALPAWSQATWPSRNIRLVLPSGAGGGSDIFGRPMADYFAKELKVAVIVDNKPGANGIVAHEQVVSAAPDGYTLCISFAAAILGNKLLNTKMSHDTMKDLRPIGRIGGGGGNLLVVTPDLPVHNLKELVAHAKASKGGLNYASWGIGSGGHLVMEMVKARTGMDITHVPYKTVSSITPDLMANVIQVATIDSATPLGLIKAGKLRAICALGASRAPQLPDVATLAEQGIPFDASPWYGLFGPAGLSDDLTMRINALLNKWISLPETKAFFEQKQNNAAPTPTTPSEFAAQLKAELVTWQALITAAKITPN